MTRMTLEEYRNSFIGKTINWLTIIDIYRDALNKNHRVCLCKCRCGNIKEIDLIKVISGHTKSCGCYKKSNELANKISDWYKNNPDKVKEKAVRFSQWCKNNKDKTTEWGRKYSEWCKNNPDKVKNAANKRRLLYKEQPDILIKRGKKYSEWCKNNKDKVKIISKKRSHWWHNHSEALNNLSLKLKQWCKDNPDKLKERIDKYKQWCKDNPDKLKERADKYKQWRKDNPDKVADIGNKVSNYYKNNPSKAHTLGEFISKRRLNNRLSSDVNSLLEIIHPDSIDDLLNGKLTAASVIKTQCPRCCDYDSHLLSNVFIWSRSELKLGRPPLCSLCRNSITVSIYEQEVSDYISTFYSGECIRNTRNIIPPQELDLYYPEKKIAIEFNGDYWHSSLFKDKEYHYNKFKKCREIGVILVSIFEREWLNNKHVIENYIADIFSYRENALSFVSDNVMNNNYPLPYSSELCSYIEYSYSVGKLCIVTCGYSKVLRN